MATEIFRKFFQFGHCKFGEKCRKSHVKENCDSTMCDIQACQLRHPKPCKYFAIYKFCKFGDYCDFKHMEERGSSNLKELEQKVSALEAKICDLESIIEQIIQKEAGHEADDSHETENESECDTDTNDHSECFS